MIRKSLTLLCICLGLATSSHAAIIADANLIMSYFSATCPSQGAWTQAALTSSANLVSVLEAIRDDRQNCGSLSGSLTQLQTLNLLFNNMSQDPNQVKIESLQKQQQEILMMAQATSNPTQAAELATHLQNVNIELASVKGSQLASQSFQQTRSQAMALQNIVQGSTALLNQAAQSPNCIQKNPGVLPAIASLAGSAQAVLSTGGSSLLIAAGADILNSLFAAARDRRINRAIRAMSLPNAASSYSCVLESLSNQWCAAQDGFEIAMLSESARSKKPSSEPSPMEIGIKLLNVDYRIFMNWLTSIQAGTDPANTSMADRQNNFFAEELFWKSGRAGGLGLIADNRELFTSRPSDAERFVNLQTLISFIVNRVLPGSANNTYNPYALVFGSDSMTIAAWFLFGVDVEFIPPNPQGGRMTIDGYNYVQFHAMYPKIEMRLDLVESRFKKWTEMALDRVNLDRKRIVYADPCKLVMDAITPRISGQSPYSSLDALITFMSINRTPSFQGIYTNTVTTLARIKEEIDRVANGSCDMETSQASITNIFNSAQLQNGTGFLGERLLWALRLSLNGMITKPQGVSNAQDNILLAAQDLVQMLQQYNGEDKTYSKIALDAKTSQQLVEATLQNFADTFGEQIADAMTYYRDQIKINGEIQPTITNTLNPATGGNAIALSKMCLLLLSVPQWPEDVPPELCYGRLLNSMSAQGPISKIIGPALMQTNYRSRMCTFRDYLRANDLFDKFNQNGLLQSF